MTWSTANDLRGQLERRWARGEFLRDAVNGNNSFPLRLTLKSPGSRDITERFDAVRTWSQDLAQLANVRVEWKTVRHRVQGEQRVADSVWVDTLDDALRWLGRKSEWQQFSAQVSDTRHTCPALLAWVAKKPLQALSLHGAWPYLLAVVNRIAATPRPGIYLRQLDISGVHSKFIETHRGVLTELLDLALPDGAINHEYTGSTQFAARYGFRDKPGRIRFRRLDEQPVIAGLPAGSDVTLDAQSFSQLTPDVQHVFITENEINFLTFPPLSNALVIFGSGYGWDQLARAPWLHHQPLYYWGDIDTHGFAILDQLRRYFPSVCSLLMNHATLLAHRTLWGMENKPALIKLTRLTQTEQDLYADLQANTLGHQIRLEQEHIGFEWVQSALQRLE